MLCSNVYYSFKDITKHVPDTVTDCWPNKNLAQVKLPSGAGGIFLDNFTGEKIFQILKDGANSRERRNFSIVVLVVDRP